MASDNKPRLDQVLYMHTKQARPYHSSVLSFKIGPNRQGRELYARATHMRHGICYLEFHYLDDNTRVYGKSVHFRVYPTLGRRDDIMQPVGADNDGNIPHLYYLSTLCSYSIYDADTKDVLARIDFKPIILSTITGTSQAKGVIISPGNLVFPSMWDNPTINPTEERIKEDYDNGIIRVHFSELEDTEPQL